MPKEVTHHPSESVLAHRLKWEWGHLSVARLSRWELGCSSAVKPLALRWGHRWTDLVNQLS